MKRAEGPMPSWGDGVASPFLDGKPERGGAGLPSSPTSAKYGVPDCVTFNGVDLCSC